MPSLPKLTPGAVFAQDYKIVRPLAEGGMGAVYVVEQLSTGKLRALKVMHPTYVTDAKMRERFAQEARIGGRIVSEHIVETVAAGIDAPTGTPWLVMELLEGEDLARTILRRGALPQAEARELLAQLCDGLGAAHAQGIVHRDLKPENLFIEVSRRRGVPFTLKLLDFGVARQIALGVASQGTMAVGTPLWMAPEQSDGRSLSPATDVWAIGLVAFQMLTAKVYWRIANQKDGIDLAALLFEILGGPLDPPSVRARELGFTGSLPPGFDLWFSRCVAREPAERFQHGNEAGAWLSAAFDPAGPPPGAIMPTPVAPAAAVPGAIPPTAPPAPMPLSTPPVPMPPVPMRQGSMPVSTPPVSLAASARTVAFEGTPGLPQGVGRLPMGQPMVPRPPPAPPPRPKRKVWRWVLALVVLPMLVCVGAIALVAAGVWSLHSDDPGEAQHPAPTGTPTPQGTEPVAHAMPAAPVTVGAPWDWADGATATWHGLATDQDARWSFTMTLRRDGETVDGTVVWTVTAPGSAGHGHAGEVIQDRVGGHYHADHHSIRVSGKDGNASETVSSSEYHLHLATDGEVHGQVTLNGEWSPDMNGVVNP